MHFLFLCKLVSQDVLKYLKCKCLNYFCFFYFRTDSGNYRCHAINRLGTSASEQIKLTVLCKFKILTSFLCKSFSETRQKVKFGLKSNKSNISKDNFSLRGSFYLFQMPLFVNLNPFRSLR